MGECGTASHSGRTSCRCLLSRQADKGAIYSYGEWRRRVEGAMFRQKAKTAMAIAGRWAGDSGLGDHDKYLQQIT